MKLQFISTFVLLTNLIMMACNSSKSVAETEGMLLTQNPWLLIEIQEKLIIHEGINRQASLAFTAEGNKVTGSTSCNRLFGTFTLTGDEKIQFNGIGSTRMACSDMSIENAFLKALKATDAYSISGKELLLKQGETVVARLRSDPSL